MSNCVNSDVSCLNFDFLIINIFLFESMMDCIVAMLLPILHCNIAPSGPHRALLALQKYVLQCAGAGGQAWVSAREDAFQSVWVISRPLHLATNALNPDTCVMTLPTVRHGPVTAVRHISYPCRHASWHSKQCVMILPTVRHDTPNHAAWHSHPCVMALSQPYVILHSHAGVRHDSTVRHGTVTAVRHITQLHCHAGVRHDSTVRHGTDTAVRHIT